MADESQTKAGSAKAKAPQTAPADAGSGEANPELLRFLDATTRQALDRLQEASSATAKLIADMTTAAQAAQLEASERTAAAAERLLRPGTAPADAPKPRKAERPSINESTSDRPTRSTPARRPGRRRN